MFWHLLLVITLPLIKWLMGGLLQKHYTLHRICLSGIILSNLLLSLSLPISQTIYTVDLGFITLHFMCDIYSYLFGILVNVIWFLTNLYSYSYIKLNICVERMSGFSKYFALSIFAVLANGYAADLWTLFVFYIVLVVLTAPLILSYKTDDAKKASRLYLVTHLGAGFILFLPAIVLVQYYTGSVLFDGQHHLFSVHNNALSASILALFVLGISQNCLLPFHHWLSRAVVAPTPVSGLLHSVAAVKSGSIAIIKIVVYIFGLEYIQELTHTFWTGGWIFWICGITAVYAAFRAWKTNHIKKRFAYSTISQLSYIMTSVFIATPLSVMGGVLHMISHSLCKIILFYIAGVFSTIYNVHNTKEIAKIAPHMKKWIAGIAFGGASIIGIPLLPGSFGKDYMILAELQTHHYMAILFLMMGSIINILYIYPIVKSGFFTKNPEPMALQAVPLSMRVSVVLALGLAVSMSLFIDDLIGFFTLYGF